jgi:hypothetical protein
MRPTAFKRGGGGFLNGVDAVFTGYSFLTGETVKIKNGARKGEDFTPLSLVPTFRVDGADADVSQRLLIGDADNYGPVSEDGLTLEMGDGAIGASSEAGIFIDSLVEGGFPVENFDEDETTLNLEPVIGTRLRLVQEVNADKTKRQGKQKNEKTGKEYDRRDLKVATVHEVGAGPAKAAKGGKPAKGAKAPKAADVSELAAATLTDILAANDGSIATAKLKMKVFAAFGAKHPQRDQRDAVIAYLTDTDNFAALDGISYDAKKGTLSIA